MERAAIFTSAVAVVAAAAAAVLAAIRATHETLVRDLVLEMCAALIAGTLGIVLLREGTLEIDLLPGGTREIVLLREEIPEIALLREGTQGIVQAPEGIQGIVLLQERTREIVLLKEETLGIVQALAVLLSHNVMFARQKKDRHGDRGERALVHVRLGEHERKKGIVLLCLGGADLG